MRFHGALHSYTCIESAANLCCRKSRYVSWPNDQSRIVDHLYCFLSRTSCVCYLTFSTLLLLNLTKYGGVSVSFDLFLPDVQDSHVKVPSERLLRVSTRQLIFPWKWKCVSLQIRFESLLVPFNYQYSTSKQILCVIGQFIRPVFTSGNGQCVRPRNATSHLEFEVTIEEKLQAIVISNASDDT